MGLEISQEDRDFILKREDSELLNSTWKIEILHVTGTRGTSGLKDRKEKGGS